MLATKSERKLNNKINVGELHDKESSIGIEKGGKTVADDWTADHVSDGGAAKGATDDVRESVRRSLERVESI